MVRESAQLLEKNPMANAFTTKIDIEVTAVVAVMGYVLELDTDEAQTLADILVLIGGSPKTTRRVFADHITRALREVDVIGQYSSDVPDRSGQIVFTTGEKSHG